MDLFEAYPQLAEKASDKLQSRSLRLIAVSGFIYDENDFYFELGAPRYWGRLPGGQVAIGVGAPKVQPDGTFPPHHAMVRYLRQTWRCRVGLFGAGHSYLLDTENKIDVLHQVETHIPYLFIFTPPRLGGAEVPDALVQAVYLFAIERIQADRAEVNLLRISRDALDAYLEPERWPLAVLQDKPWAAFLTTDPLPTDALLRPVLALRGLRRLLEADMLPRTLEL
jgi:hypothetical protein